jgi:pilus assembly protein Flp/PilA
MEKMIRVMLWWDEAKQALRNQKGQGMVEYGLIIGLVAIVAIGALTLMSGGITGLLTRVNTALTGAGAAPAAP